MEHSTILKQRRKFLLLLPLVALPFLCLIFKGLGGGGAPARKDAGTFGLNFELPGPRFDPKQTVLNKLKVYEKADRDSLRKQQYRRQDPYRVESTTPIYHTPAQDPRATLLLERLTELKRGLAQPRPTAATPPQGELRVARKPDTAVNDPELAKVNEMLDKVIRIQHPEEHKASVNPPSHATDLVLPADTMANTIAAVVTEDQNLTNGTTIALRITDSIQVNGTVLPAGQLIYGAVNINNDRLLVHITSLRQEKNLYATDLQVYDLDGLPGIHIPGLLSRDVAKQSADQGVNSLNVLSMDPSLGAQAMNAGIQTARSFASRKVRQVRVAVRAGYQVLLRSDKIKEHTRVAPGEHVEQNPDLPEPPAANANGRVLERCRLEGMELSLREVRLDSGRLWFGLEWANHSAIGYKPAYIRWYIRDHRAFRRTAIQELPLSPLRLDVLQLVAGVSIVHSWTGFTPFTIAKDKELVVQAGEKEGGRVLTMVIGHKQLLHAKNYTP